MLQQERLDYIRLPPGSFSSRHPRGHITAGAGLPGGLVLGRGPAAGGAARAVGCMVTITGLGLCSSGAPLAASTAMPTTPPSRTLPANPAAPVPAISLVSGTTSA